MRVDEGEQLFEKKLLERKIVRRKLLELKSTRGRGRGADPYNRPPWVPGRVSTLSAICYTCGISAPGGALRGPLSAPELASGCSRGSPEVILGSISTLWRALEVNSRFTFFLRASRRS